MIETYERKKHPVQGVQFDGSTRSYDEAKILATNAGRLLNMVAERHPNGKRYLELSSPLGLVKVGVSDYVIFDDFSKEIFVCSKEYFERQFQILKISPEGFLRKYSHVKHTIL